MSSSNGWTTIRTIAFGFAPHGNPEYETAHERLNASYSAPLAAANDLFVDPQRSDLVPDAYALLHRKILETIASRARPTQQDVYQQTQLLFFACPLFAVDDDGDRLPLRSNDDLVRILDAAVDEGKSKALIHLNINGLHFRDGFAPEKLADISTTPLAGSSTLAVDDSCDVWDRTFTEVDPGVEVRLSQIQPLDVDDEFMMGGHHHPNGSVGSNLSILPDMMDAIEDLIDPLPLPENNNASSNSASIVGGSDAAPRENPGMAPMADEDCLGDLPSPTPALSGGPSQLVSPYPSDVEDYPKSSTATMTDDDDASNDSEDSSTKPMKPKENIDKIISKELLKLSLKDRNQIDEEVHGITNLTVDETPEFLEKSLIELAAELDRIPDQDPTKASYLESQSLPETYVNTSNFRLRFLRCQLFDAKKAAHQMLGFLDFAHELFGPEALRRPIAQSDLTKAERKEILIGNYQFLPYRDRSGHPIFCQVGGFDSKNTGESTIQSKHRQALYVQWVGTDDVENQQKGVTTLIWTGSNNPVRFSGNFSNWESLKYVQKLVEFTPMRSVCVHWCLPDLPYFHMLRAAYGVALRSHMSRLKFHVGDDVELQYTLKGFGIPVELIPVTQTGNIKTQHLKQWMKTRQHVETLRAQRAKQRKDGSGTDDDVDRELDSVIEFPRSTDVVFRGGTSLTCHPGNARLQGLIETHLAAHRAETGTEMPNKDLPALAASIVRVISKDGRFLVWDKKGWWTPLRDDYEIALKIEAKAKRERTKRAARTQTCRSSTSVFSNQDHARFLKRRRMVDGSSSPRDDSDGSGTKSCCFLG